VSALTASAGFNSRARASWPIFSCSNSISSYAFTLTPGHWGMRKHFHRDLRGKIIGELAKDFSRHPLEDVASLIADA